MELHFPNLWIRPGGRRHPTVEKWIERRAQNLPPPLESAANYLADLLASPVEGVPLRGKIARMSLLDGWAYADTVHPMIVGPNESTVIGSSVDTLGSGMQSTDWRSDLGFTGIGNSDVQQHLKLSVFPDEFPVGDWHACAAASITNSNQVGWLLFAGGAVLSTAPHSGLILQSNTVKAVHSPWWESPSVLHASTSNTAGYRRYIGSATSSTDLRVYINGVQGFQRTTERTQMSIPREYFAMAGNYNGTPSNALNGRLLFYSLGYGLSPVQAAALDEAVALYLARRNRY